MAKHTICWREPPFTLVRGQEGYPTPLLDLDEPPLTVRVLGGLPAVGSTAVAIVGTRHPSDEACEFAFRLAADLAQLGVTIVSGGALGIDAAAHRGALSMGGATLVVLASGLQTAYPARNGPLFDEVVASGNGALLSEGADHWAPHAGLFLRRNRLIAALAAVTVVVQGALRSGALSTAHAAMSMKRRVFSVPGCPWDPRAEGTLALLLQGCEICTSARDVLSLRPSEGPSTDTTAVLQTENAIDIDGLGGESGNLYRRLQQSPAHPDRIARELGISTGRVQELLLSLELGGLIRRRMDGTYSAASIMSVSGEGRK